MLLYAVWMTYSERRFIMHKCKWCPEPRHLKDSSELLPAFDKAIIPDSKITGYVLNKNHPVGKNKAIAFVKYLGYTVEDKDQLVSDLRVGIGRYKCAIRAKTKYGQPYKVTMVIKGINGKYARVKTGWIINNGTAIPRLITAYVDE